MCCRYYIQRSEPMDRLIEIINRRAPLSSPVKTEGEISPGDLVPVVACNKQRKATAFAMKWGFHLPDRKLVFNTRSESAAIKPMFRDSFRQRRCIIPASWYFEWDAAKQRHTMRSLHQEEMLFLAGLYRPEGEGAVFSILTREPGEALSRIHPRMPLILPQTAVRAWIDPASGPEALMELAVTELNISVV